MLKHSRRVLITSDAAYNCLQFKEDDNGVRYVHINTRDVVASAEEALKAVLTRMGPKILPLSELVHPHTFSFAC